MNLYNFILNLEESELNLNLILLIKELQSFHYSDLLQRYTSLESMRLIRETVANVATALRWKKVSRNRYKFALKVY
jgi:ribosomal protein L29